MAPNELLLLPAQVQEKAIPLARAGALGAYRLTEDVSHDMWQRAEEVVREILGRPTTLHQIQRLGTALDPAEIAGVDDGAYSLLPDPGAVDAALIDDALNSPLHASHRGWGLVRAVATALAIDSGRPLQDVPATTRDAIVRIVRALCRTVAAPFQISVLQTLATARPTQDSAAGRLFGRLVEAFAASDEFFGTVLPHIELPTQDRQWHHAGDIARSASGVSRRHRLLSSLRAPLRLDADEPLPMQTGVVLSGSGTREPLAKYFEAWAGRVPNGAVAAFLSLLGDGWEGEILTLSRRWAGDDVSVGGMRRELTRGAPEPWRSIKIYVSGEIARGTHVNATNLLGERAEMEAGSEHDSVFATEPNYRDSNVGKYWEINLRDVMPRTSTPQELLTFLRGAVEWWAGRVLRIPQSSVGSWWSRWGAGSQAQVGPVQASILAHLPLILHELDVRERPVLNNALKHAQRAQRIREQEPSREAIDAERRALDQLAALIRQDPEHQRFIWTRIQNRMTRFGYRPDSVLLELAQNADDALSQAAEIAGRPLPPAARRLIVRVAETDGTTTVDVLHHGRPINDAGGAAFSAGRDREWDQDLYFMMLPNLSGKPGEIPGQSTRASTAGQFGLGFKAVHLVSQQPTVVSGFLAFSIVASLLPIEQPLPDEPDLQPVHGHLPTRVRLPLRTDVPVSDLIDQMFRRFTDTRALLPAFARSIREVVVDGGRYAGVTAFNADSIADAPGWSVSDGVVRLGGADWRLLRFRPSDATNGVGTAALVIGLREGRPQPLPLDLPFLWNVTPTSEYWACGYAINGPFKLDPGRTHVSLDDRDTLRVVDLLGEALGTGLVELHGAVVNEARGPSSPLPAPETAADFLSSLWRVLATGLDSPDALRRDVFLRLHGPGRGLSVWMHTRSVVPSDLPTPFAERLPPLTAETRLEIASAGLDDPAVCQAFSRVGDLTSLARKHCAVSGQVAQRLRPLLGTVQRFLRPWDILLELTESWNHILTPERLHTLRPLADEAVWKAISNDSQPPPWSSRLLGRSVAGRLVSLRQMLLPRSLSERIEPDVTAEDELRRAAFAPDARVLDPAYFESGVDLTMFLRLRGRHEIDAATMASWYVDLRADQRPAALRYLLDGRLRIEVLERLMTLDVRPAWLQDFDGVQSMLGDEDWRTRMLLTALFPDRFQRLPDAGPPRLSEHARRDFFAQLEEWWDDGTERRRVLTSYEERAWPDWLRRGDGLAAGLKGDSLDHWLAIFVLGACRSIGQTNDGQHRTFLEELHRGPWWDVFKNPGNPAAWMDVLRDWQDQAVANLKYLRWMSLFPAIYQLSRYVEKYRLLLRSGARRPQDLYNVTRILAPRIDGALTGAGQRFDAPPAPLGLGLHWILRELVRLGVLDGDHLFQDCWVPSEQVVSFLRPLGLDSPDDNASNADAAKTIFRFMASALNTPLPHLHRAFDIPLRHVQGDPALRRRLGLDT